MTDPKQPEDKDSGPDKKSAAPAKSGDAQPAGAQKDGAGTGDDTGKTPARPSPPRKSRRFGRWLVLLLLLLLAGAAAAGYLLYRHAPDRLETRLQQIGLPQIAALVAERAPGATGQPPGQTADQSPGATEPETPSRTAPSDSAGTDAMDAPQTGKGDSGLQAPSPPAMADTDAPAPEIETTPPATDVTPELARVTETLDRLTRRMGAIESGLEKALIAAEQTGTAPEAGLPASLEGTLLTLTDGMTDVSTGLIALAARVDTLEAREKVAPLARTRQLSYALGLRELDRALQGSGSFSNELSALAELTGENPAFGPLHAHAEEGIPSEAVLRLRFPATARAIVNAGQTGAEAGWAERIRAALRGLIMLRPTGEVAGDDAAAIVARAETRLQAGDLHAAVQQLSQLEGPAAAAAQDWLVPARNRLAAQQAMAELTAQLTRAIAE